MKWKILVNAIALSICLLMSWRWANAQALREALARHHRLHAPQDPGTSTTTKWTLLFPTQIPDERFAASAAYDIATNSLLVFAGANFSTIRNDLLSLSNANGLGTSEWTTVIPDGAAGSPSGRTFHTAVYDENSSRMVVFGGCSFTGQLCTTLLNDVWVLSNANGVGGTPTWSQISPAGAGPAPRWGHAAAYDFANNRMIIYGGEDDSQIFSDVWVLSNANSLGGTPTWTQLSPSGALPEGRDSASIVYDPTNNLLIQFAGITQDGATDANSVWVLSNANGLGGAPMWKNILHNGAKGAPPKRDGHVAFYDGANNRLVIFGGNANNPTGFPQYNDVWVLANANDVSGIPHWFQVSTPAPQPDGRTSPVSGYDPVNNRLIIFGGTSWDGDFFSTWVLSASGGF